MTSTAIALILFVLLLVTLELRLRATAEVKRLKAAAVASQETYRVALGGHQRDIKAYRTMLADAHNATRVTTEVLEVAEGRIDNLCEQLEEARKGRRHYYDVAAERAQQIHTLSCELAESRLASFANLSDMTSLTALQQENKLDALCEVIKTLMQRDQLCDAAVASFGGRLSRAVQVYRKDLKARSEAQAEYHPDDFNPLTALSQAIEVELAKGL